MNGKISFCKVIGALNRRPQAMARVQGSGDYPEISGCVRFYQMDDGALVAAQITGLPEPTVELPSGIFGFHIHSGQSCTGTKEDPFADALTHFDPKRMIHPLHAGDLPPLFANHGEAFQMFFTDRFSVREIIHRTVIIHSGPDDFTSQPAGNAGEKIACGEIKAFSRHSLAFR